MSPTRRQLISAGLPFCSLQATTQHLQPMHFPMSKWNRYCSPGSSARVGMRAERGTGPPGRSGASNVGTGRFVSAKVTPSSVARFKSGSDIDTPMADPLGHARA